MPKMIFAIVFDFGIILSIALMAGIANKRIDVIAYTPLYPLLRFVDSYVFIKGFWNIIVMRRTSSDWNSVRRYTQTAGGR
ncbi:hypothetical protein GW943_00465 [Candidatus Parcubacteria bacterium]|uniref:Uncharacterized protein n=1 Tax=Candidatus Kaiserbacteria bacterium CG10_big_fil_rev_8_21_14_0_10_47_16 TaxID=1974608 RepID=A0A2H0UD18_9BACT|nr:hypothetical protein [Candidatus Parcubacteria bacterium]PIR84318.1 MAG: hypothetical protein COU16_01850 [Candidatus Kaiserbacteria bacterium CG10_big_fil_rev_8_21_14_0_10_47_16]